MSEKTSAGGSTSPGGTAVMVGVPSGANPPAHRHLGLALLVIATAQLMVVLDATIVNVALPDIQKALGFSGAGLGRRQRHRDHVGDRDREGDVGDERSNARDGHQRR